MTRQSPGVHYPPPLLYVIGFGIGWLLHRAWPMALFSKGRSAGAVLSGWLLIGLALALLALSGSNVAQSPKQKSVILLMADDHSFQLGAYDNFSKVFAGS